MVLRDALASEARVVKGALMRRRHPACRPSARGGNRRVARFPAAGARWFPRGGGAVDLGGDGAMQPVGRRRGGSPGCGGTGASQGRRVMAFGEVEGGAGSGGASTAGEDRGRTGRREGQGAW